MGFLSLTQHGLTECEEELLVELSISCVTQGQEAAPASGGYRRQFSGAILGIGCDFYSWLYTTELIHSCMGK